MAVASGAPIQIGTYRSPSRSRSNRIGLLVGISTRTPITSTCFTDPTLLPREVRPHQREVQLQALTDQFVEVDVVRHTAQAAHEGNLPLGGQPKRAQMPRLDAIGQQRRRR